MRKRTLLVALAILALGLIGTGLSALYEKDEFIVTNFLTGTRKVSYGFPLGWHGHSDVDVGFPIPDGFPIPQTYWFSLELFLLDAAFWVTISFFACIAAMKSVDILRRTRASKNLSVINI